MEIVDKFDVGFLTVQVEKAEYSIFHKIATKATA